MDNKTVEFREWLNQELVSRKWKQADLVRSSGLDSAVISNLINGKRKPGETTLNAIARAFKLPPETVFSIAKFYTPTYSPEKDNDPSLLEWIKMYKDADEKVRSEMLNYARYMSEKQADKRHA